MLMKKYAFTSFLRGWIEKVHRARKYKFQPLTVGCLEAVAVSRLKTDHLSVAVIARFEFRECLRAIKFFNLYLLNGAILMFHGRRERASDLRIQFTRNRDKMDEPWSLDPAKRGCALTRRTNKRYNLFNRLTRDEIFELPLRGNFSYEASYPGMLN